LAAIAAPLVKKQTAELTPIAAVGVAHELLMAAGRYINALPEQKRGTERIIEDFRSAFSTVTFAEIAESNQKGSGQLPFLPPIGQKKKSRTQQEIREKPLSVNAIKDAVRDFLSKHTPEITREDYERDQGQSKRVIDDCMENSRVSLQDLCRLRWERFEKSSRDQQARRRKPKPRPQKLSKAFPVKKTAVPVKKYRAAVKESQGRVPKSKQSS
jgi:hypothetical protein